jgi:hypothetical protein
VKGHTVCKLGKVKCEAKEGENGDYCAHCGGACGACLGQPCGVNNLCTPNVECSGLAGVVVCHEKDNDWCSPAASPLCWHKEDLGKCLGTLVGGSGGSAQ